jgi:hypothetical protein
VLLVLRPSRKPKKNISPFRKFFSEIDRADNIFRKDLPIEKCFLKKIKNYKNKIKNSRGPKEIWEEEKNSLILLTWRIDK